MLGLSFASARQIPREISRPPVKRLANELLNYNIPYGGIPPILVPYGIDYAMLIMMGIQSWSVRVMVLMIPHQMPGQKPLKKTEETHSVWGRKNDRKDLQIPQMWITEYFLKWEVWKMYRPPSGFQHNTTQDSCFPNRCFTARSSWIELIRSRFMKGDGPWETLLISLT